MRNDKYFNTDDISGFYISLIALRKRIRQRFGVIRCILSGFIPCYKFDNPTHTLNYSNYNNAHVWD